MAYGYNVDPEGPDYMLALADEAVKKIFSEASEPGKWLVDIIPARTSYTYKYHAYGALMHVWYRVTVKYLPEWLPGSGFKRQHDSGGRLCIELTTYPLISSSARWQVGGSERRRS